ncbi:MAG: metal-dependent transcriptional regulator [Actinomycetota bacterium]|jgi:DtxR family transcriptional regulator, Mn-dependent transcriptional regulator
MADGFHPPVEEYLEAIWELEEEGTLVIQARLAEHLGHSAPTVSETVKRLREDGYVTIDRRVLQLTAPGRERAESVVRKHRLAERFLLDVIGIPWSQTHIEACRWEHVMSDAVEERIRTILGNPTSCAHGNPIPGSEAPDVELYPLADTQPGDRVRLERVTEQVEVDQEALDYLDSHGFIPGADAEVRTKAPDGTLTLDLKEGSIALGPGLARLLYVATT